MGRTGGMWQLSQRLPETRVRALCLGCSWQRAHTFEAAGPP